MSEILASQELASGYLNIALENNMLLDFLVGRPLFELKVKDGYGNTTFSSMHVMEAIYDKYREDANLMLDKKVYEEFLNELKVSKFPKDIFNITEDILYHINSEKTGTAPFSMDCITLLEELKNNLSRNKAFYTYSNEQHNIKSVWPQIEDYNDRVFNSSGKRII